MSKSSFQSRAGLKSNRVKRSRFGGGGSQSAVSMPRYLTQTKMTVTTRPRPDAAEARAEQAAREWSAANSDAPISVGAPVSGPANTSSRTLAGNASTGGMPLPADWQARATARYGIDGGAVRVHTDSRAGSLARGMGANAVTLGNNIFLGSGRYAPETGEGERLLAHELAHVAQQGGEPRAMQCDLRQTEPVTLGVFDLDMTTQAATATSNAGLMGTIKFEPDPNGPYSAEIGLIQAVNVTDIAGTTNRRPGGPMDWSNDVPGGPNPEAERMELMTTGAGVAPEGWFIDSRTAGNTRGSSIGPNYMEHFISPPPDNQYGWLRSSTDSGPASLWDFPNSPHDVDFDFETVAKGTDNQTVYGSLFWGFGIRSRAVRGGSEYAVAQDSATAVFEEALERFRGFFVHEPVVLYYDTADPIPRAGEEAKLADIPDYLSRYPDVMIQIDGFADIRGSEPYNLNLAQERAESAANLLLLQGVDASRIDNNMVIGWGETQEFSQHGTAPGARQPITPGRLQANRRAVIRFVHTVSNHPIVMP